MCGLEIWHRESTQQYSGHHGFKIYIIYSSVILLFVVNVVPTVDKSTDAFCTIANLYSSSLTSEEPQKTKQLLVLAVLVSVCYCARLDNTYLPPPNADKSGGGPGLQTPFGPRPGGPGGSPGFGGKTSGPGFNGAPSGPGALYGPPRGGPGGPGRPGGQPGFGPNQGGQPGFGPNQGGQPGFGPSQGGPDAGAPILRYDNTPNAGDGSYQYSYETGNGIKAEEEGHARPGATEEEGGEVVRGSYSYTAPDGQVIEITYTADENGFVPQGAHLPTPPPIPEEILRSLEQNAAEEARGGGDSGNYGGQPGGPGGYPKGGPGGPGGYPGQGGAGSYPKGGSNGFPAPGGPGGFPAPGGPGGYPKGGPGSFPAPGGAGGFPRGGPGGFPAPGGQGGKTPGFSPETGSICEVENVSFYPRAHYPTDRQSENEMKISTESLDVILFGATGVTGKSCIRYLHKFTKTSTRTITWGVSGRNKQKLIGVLEECSKLTGENLKSVPIFVADVEDGDALNNMTSNAKILINCTGPYQLYGEPVVLACIETFTHYIDVSGEPYYMEYIVYKYNRLAKQRGVYIVSSCGFDSIPTDLGIVFMQQNFEGILNSVEIYLSVFNKIDKDNVPVNYTTWESAIVGKENYEKLKSVRKQIFKKPLPRTLPKLPRRPSIFKNDITNTWAKRYNGCDRSVIYRTQKYFYEHDNIRPIQVNIYQVVNSFVNIQTSKFKSNLVNFFLDYSFGKMLVLKYPQFFSGIKFVTEYPTDNINDNIEFSTLLHGKGWSKNVDLKNMTKDQPPDRDMICELSGGSPAYGFTSLCATLCAIVVITETDKLPNGGGVYTPGVAFAKTSLMSQLMQNGLRVKIRSKL
ncbi:hypothetical protein FQR65_LT11477 [Abscondita terminalis]|nr:hypothetical protein FQR65_LT11477 [Abscondita terminalis]